MSRCLPITRDPPPMKDLTTENITENVKILNNQCPNPRIRYILDRLVTHLHDFAREARLSTEEWQAGISFLTRAGQISNEKRAELILLSDVLGFSLLVDAINHPRPPNATEGTVLGPFHTHDAPTANNGYVLHEDPDAPRLLVIGSIKSTRGEPIQDVTCDVWEGDAYGFYDVQNPNRTQPDGRAVLKSDRNGTFYFNAVIPVPYPIPMDGPVGQMLTLLNRHPNRPGHIHFMLQKSGYDTLITALYPRGDPYESSDPVFGVKETLIIDLETVDEETARKYNASVGMKMVRYSFVLMDDQEALLLREKNSKEALEKLGISIDIVNGLPVPGLD